MIKRLGIILLAFACSLMLFGMENKTIVAAADPWPPFVDPQNTKEGFSLEIIRAAYKTQGYTVKMEYVPWARAEMGVKKGIYDILPDVWYTDSRAKEMLFSEPYAKNQVKFIALKDSNFKYTDLPSLSGKIIGTIRGFGYSEEFLNASNFERSEVKDLIQNVRKLIAGRIDMTIEDEIVARVRIAQEDPDLLNEIKFIDNPFSSNNLYISAGFSNPDHKEIVEAFNKGLKEIKENGTFEKILEQYGF